MNIPDLIRVAGNYIRTSTISAFDNNDLAFDVYDPTKIENEGGLLEVEYDIPHKREVIYVLSKSGNTLTIADDGRGLYGTNAQDHPANSKVRDFFVDDHINQFIDSRTGWSTQIQDTWTYASATTITVPSGATNLYSIGDRLKLTQTTEKYFYIIGVTDTLLTITGGTNYTLANAAISNIHVSKELNPVGFPAYFDWTPVITGKGSMTFTSSNIVYARFSVIGGTASVEFMLYGTIGGTMSDLLYSTTPIKPKFNQVWSPFITRDTASFRISTVRTSNVSNRFEIARDADGNNYVGGVNGYVVGNFTYYYTI
jgi:hypothetical protein